MSRLQSERVPLGPADVGLASLGLFVDQRMHEDERVSSAFGRMLAKLGS